MSGVKLVVRQKIENNMLCIELPAQPYKQRLLEVLKKCNDKCNGYCTIEINRPYKPRTTGKLSQNNLVWKLIQIIADETGEEVKEIEHQAKMKAISRGYPYHVSPITAEPVPESMKKINTVECSYLIDTLYEIVAFLGINLEPELSKENHKEEVSSLVDQALREKDSFEYECRTYTQNDLF